MKEIRLGSARARPGAKSWGQLVVRQRAMQAPLPVAVVHGASPGPHVVLLANQHGLELNGIESVRRFVEEVDPRRLKGTVFAFPSVNPRATMLRSQVWPEDRHARLVRKFGDGPYNDKSEAYAGRYNMNYIWPGRKGGRLTERVAFEIWNRAVMAPHRKADLVVDFHCHQARTTVWADDDTAVDFGVASGVPRVVMMRSWGDEIVMCTMACGRNGIPSVAFELGGQGAIVPQSVEQGVTAIRNLLKLHRMMPGALELPKEVAIFDPWRSDLIKKTFRRPTYEKYWAQHPGLVVRRREPHTFVRKGDIVCQVVNPYTGKIVQTARAARSGGLYSMTDEAVCNKGDRLFVVSLAWKVRPAEYLRKIKNRFGASPATKEESRHGA